MGLNESKGNMYEFVTHTWNTVKGKCPHGCSYCYMTRWGAQKPPRLDETEFKTDLGTGNYIFVGSSNDLFAADHPKEWIERTLDHCANYENKYLFQSKNPGRMKDFIWHDAFWFAMVCTTLETNRHYPKHMVEAPAPAIRAADMKELDQYIRTCITIEPIMDFDMEEFVQMIRACHPFQVNIGADSGNNHLPEPTAEKVNALITELSVHTNVVLKPNLKRILNAK